MSHVFRLPALPKYVLIVVEPGQVWRSASKVDKGRTVTVLEKKDGRCLVLDGEKLVRLSCESLRRRFKLIGNGPLPTGEEERA